MTDSSENPGDLASILPQQGPVVRQPDSPLHVVLFEPEIAANTGAVGRTCVAAGATLWLVRPLGFHLDDRHLRRAGLDYWEHLDLRVVDRLDEVVAKLGRNRLWSFSTKAPIVYTEARIQPGDALVFGPESRGLPQSWLEACPDHALRIPIRPAARSLNLANAVAIALFEATRQVGFPVGPEQSGR
jgi:tRNA (cytidine/uridine-2'-O-)-methyltransferase